MNCPPCTVHVSRRKFIITSVQFAAAFVFSKPFEGQASQSLQHSLSFYNTHTKESLKVLFNLKKCAPVDVKPLYYFLRDFRTEEVHPIDSQLLDMLCRIQMKTGSSGTFEVISGYRSPTTNKKLRKTSSGVAKKSLHMEGRAIDIRLTDVSTNKLRSIACSMKRGGVGYYGKSDFVHLDTGRVRVW